MNDYRSMATIDLIDCGFKNKISYNQLRILPKSSSINLLPSICKEFVIAELILSKEHCDYRQKFAKFSELVVNKFFDLEILSEARDKISHFIIFFNLIPLSILTELCGKVCSTVLYGSIYRSRYYP